MKLDELRQLARERGVKPAKMTKRELVKLLQRVEGNFDCFASAVHGFCDQVACLWHHDCMKESTTPPKKAKASAPKKKSVAKKKVVKKKTKKEKKPKK